MIQLLIRTFIRDADNTTSRTVRTAYGNLACLVSVVCNLLLFAGKTAVGTLFGSVSITADGLNNLSDASSNIVSLIGFKLGSRPADSEHPYGHARYEYLAGLAVSVMILVIGVELFKESFAKTLDPTPVSFGWLTVVVLVASILVKLWMSHLNRNQPVQTNHRKQGVLHVYMTQVTGFARLDGLMGIAVSLFILYSGAMLVKDTIDPLLGSAPDPELVRHIEDKALSYPGVLGVHDLMIHDYGPGNRLVSFHVEMDANADVMYSHDVIDRIERDLLNQDDLVATIHFDPVIASDSHVAELRSFLQQEVASLDTRANIHDLRIVPGPTHTNVIFDCAVPAEYITEKQRRGAKLAAALRAAVERKWPDHFCIIKLEPDYSAGIHETK